MNVPTGDLADVGTRVAAGVAGASYTYFGLPMSDWVGLATIIYLAVSTIKNLPHAVEVVKRWVGRWRKHE